MQALTWDTYKGARDAKNFEQYRNATRAYNKRPGYTEWLRTGRDSGKQFINRYIQQNNLGEPVVMDDTQLPDEQYYA